MIIALLSLFYVEIHEGEQAWIYDSDWDRELNDLDDFLSILRKFVLCGKFYLSNSIEQYKTFPIFPIFPTFPMFPIFQSQLN